MSILSTVAVIAVLGVVGWLLYTFGKLTMEDQGQAGGVPEQFRDESDPDSEDVSESAKQSVKDGQMGEWK